MMVNENSLIRVELHLHTCYSKDSLVKLEKLLQHCQKKGISRFAITDHNVIDGAFAAQALAPENVILGEEIETTEGELLGYFMSEWVPPGLEPMETIERLRAQDAVISVAHPFDTVRSQHWSRESLLAIAPHIDAVEVFNARCLNQQPNQDAASFAEEQGLLATVGSDAHSLWELGRASLLMPDFQNVDEFKSALAHARQDVGLSPIFVHGFSRFAVYFKKLQKLLR
jgi:predicted metal-dependent phosphoesterase TrpH